jgi:hypothetical protein
LLKKIKIPGICVDVVVFAAVDDVGDDDVVVDDVGVDVVVVGVVLDVVISDVIFLVSSLLFSDGSKPNVSFAWSGAFITSFHSCAGSCDFDSEKMHRNSKQ